MGTREEIVQAVLAGAEAARDGDEPTTCPYPPTSLLRTAWIKGYARSRPIADQSEDDADT
ncbi:Rmf/CrpP fold protein [Streptomyces shenzhenensis]|uniref:Ribosome modulation factor n=1 Tax=Streptomyces shenzhenensis TaxID=943815 RepID=A0A3M0I495_9ACTN|nr:Rmf/CrpP fold protein [Streptomyces shenzhenensis]RMB83655.1 hypothetical protein CTZ28_23340 [Streptomyces shenzhenensis]